MGPGALENVRILVVEDEADARDLIETMLSVEGAKVVTASSAEEALGLLGAGSNGECEVDVLLSDIGMPGYDGYWLVEQVRKSWPKLASIALTAFTRAEDVQRAHRAGFDHHVGKPVDPDKLVALIASLCARDPPQAAG